VKQKVSSQDVVPTTLPGAFTKLMLGD